MLTRSGVLGHQQCGDVQQTQLLQQTLSSCNRTLALREHYSPRQLSSSVSYAVNIHKDLSRRMRGVMCVDRGGCVCVFVHEVTGCVSKI